MDDVAIAHSIDEFIGLLHTIRGLIRDQDVLDVETFANQTGASLSQARRAEITEALHQESLWTYFQSGLEHEAFRVVYEELVPAGAPSLAEVSAQLAVR